MTKCYLCKKEYDKENEFSMSIKEGMKYITKTICCFCHDMIIETQLEEGEDYEHGLQSD